MRSDPRHWTNEELELLRKNLRSIYILRIRLKGRSDNAIRSMAAKRGYKIRKTFKTWTIRDFSTAKQLRELGYTWRMVGEAMGISGPNARSAWVRSAKNYMTEDDFKSVMFKAKRSSKADRLIR